MNYKQRTKAYLDGTHPPYEIILTNIRSPSDKKLISMRVYCETFGCTMNRGDSEIILGQLVATGHTVVTSLTEADVVIVNTCAVKGVTYHKVLRRLRKLCGANGKHVVVAGCLPLIDPASLECIGSFAGVISCRSVDAVASVVERISKGERGVQTVEHAPCEKTNLPKLRSSKVSAIVSIAEGCVSNCSYCSVRFARGGLRSFSSESILCEIQEALRNGYREVLLTAQDTAAYGLDLGTNLPGLLNSITALGGKFKVRVGMMNPSLVKRILPALLDAYESEKVYKFLHLPVQSGDDHILQAMRRGYTADDFLKIVAAFKSRFEDLYLSTDVIVGFPGEGEEEFMHTCELIDAARPDNVNVTRFSPMPGTDAVRMPQENGRDVKRKSRLLSKKCRGISHEQNKRCVGRTLEGLLVDEGKKGGYVARLPNYKPVIVERGTLGEFVTLKIVDARPTYLLGVNA